MGEQTQKKDYTPHAEYTRYGMMPKHFVGPETADDLFSIYETLSREKPYPFYQFTAGSAAAESGLVGVHLPLAERHFRLNCAEEAWRAAQEGYLDRHIDKDWSEAKLTAFLDRVETQVIFLPLMHDMVNANVRRETSNTTHERLVRLALRNYRLNAQATMNGDAGGYSARRGIAYELATAAAITRLRCPSFFAMPSTARGDNGTFNSSETHDIQLIEQSWGRIRSSTPIEVKPSGALTYRRKHYTSAYVHGKLHLRMPSATSSLELCMFLAKEVAGTATPEEIAELNHVTSMILQETVKHPKHLYDFGKELSLAGTADRT